MSAGPEPEKGVSLYADAWRRLRKNVMAMGGLAVVIVMSVACAFAGVLAPYDATYGFTWIGAQPPGYEHPDALNRTQLQVGQRVEVRPGYQGARELKIRTLEKESVEYRVTVRRKKINAIRRVQGAIPVEELVPAEGEYLVEVLESGELGPPLTVSLKKKAKLPPEFGAKRVVLLRHVKAATPVSYAATTERQTLDDFDAAGQPIRVQAQVVVRLSRNDEPVERAEIDGRDVLEVLADGEPQVAAHLLGTDLSGRDLYSRILYGGRISLLVGLVATIVSLLIGVIYGAISGYAGGRVDTLLMAIVDILYGIPYMFLVILLLVMFGRDIVMLFVALGLVQWLTMARIVRGQILSLKQKEFVEAARMSGTGHAGIVFRHLIPNTLGVVIVYTTLTVPAVILQESFLAFIGLAVTHEGQNLESWGALVKLGSDALGNDGSRAWLLIWPSLAMAMTLFSLNFLGDGLRDALDPQQRGRT